MTQVEMYSNLLDYSNILAYSLNIYILITESIAITHKK